MIFWSRSIYWGCGQMIRQVISSSARRLAIASVIFAAAGQFDLASAQTLQGEWTNAPASCGHYSTNNNNILIRADGYRIFETFCTFTGGLKNTDDHWQMSSTCSVEGGGEEPESIDLRIVGGRLKTEVDGNVTYYASKCGETFDRPERTYWDHNGSVLYLRADGTRRRFFYSRPRPGMQHAGAQPDSILFDGTVAGETYDGTAFIFNAGCGQLPYHVSGPVLDNYRRVVLQGSAPQVDANCRVTGYRGDVLEFTLAPGQ